MVKVKPKSRVRRCNVPAGPAVQAAAIDQVDNGEVLGDRGVDRTVSAVLCLAVRRGCVLVHYAVIQAAANKQGRSGEGNADVSMAEGGLP